jgi:hypothetical protein
MRKAAYLTLVLVALATSAVVARQGTAATRWQYLHVLPGISGPLDQPRPVGYRACQAFETGWTCRSFESAKDTSGDDALARVFTRLGAEGWELVTVIDETQHLSYPKGLTYLFKREQPK